MNLIAQSEQEEEKSQSPTSPETPSSKSDKPPEPAATEEGPTDVDSTAPPMTASEQVAARMEAQRADHERAAKFRAEQERFESDRKAFEASKATTAEKEAALVRLKSGESEDPEGDLATAGLEWGELVRLFSGTDQGKLQAKAIQKKLEEQDQRLARYEQERTQKEQQSQIDQYRQEMTTTIESDQDAYRAIFVLDKQGDAAYNIALDHYLSLIHI